jgi:vancomycin aglycone glucosyltransferase
MKFLLASIGSRGDTQPMLALAVELRALGHDAVLCVPPTFASWTRSRGFECVPLGRDVRAFVTRQSHLGREELRALVPETVREQFRVLELASKDCDAIVVGGALQVAARSIAEHRNIPYTYATFCPVTLRSDDHPPPLVKDQHRSREDNVALWKQHRASVNHLFKTLIDEGRAALGLAPIDDVEEHVFTNAPLVASDPALGCTPFEQTGAWLLEDPSPLPNELERFLEDGDPPIYVGLGSMRGAPTSAVLLEAARAAGHRIVLSRGWAELASDGRDDCIVIDDVDHRKLFPRCAAIVHHGGAGTTHTAALAGRPQVIVPHNYDQFYWRDRVATLAIGAAGPAASELDAPSLQRAIERALTLSRRVDIITDGARRAAERISRPS